MHKSEEEFLKNYDSSIFEKLSMTADVLIFSISNEEVENYRKVSTKHMSVLLVKRSNYPYKDKWCLPGGFIDINEDLDKSPERILEKETNLKGIYLEQLYTFGKVSRDPRMRVVSTAYMSLIDKKMFNQKLNKEAKWFNISYTVKDNIVTIVFQNDEDCFKVKVAKKLINNTTDRYTFEAIENEHLAFDHPVTILSGIERLKNKLEYTDIVFNMMPKYFTLGELQQVYEIILNKKLIAPAFRRTVANKVEKTDKLKIGKGHRPSALFKYKKRI